MRHISCLKKSAGHCLTIYLTYTSDAAFADNYARLYIYLLICLNTWGGSVAEWLACWTQKGPGLNRSLRQTAHTHRASVHQAAKLVAALLRVARVTAGLAESNGSLPPGL